MRYDILITGDDYVYVNGGNKIHLEAFIQTLRDINQSKKINHKTYAGE
jgi:hypothetical protein